MIDKALVGKRTCLAILAIYVMATVLAPAFANYGEAEIVGQVWQHPSGTFWLGTDMLGRDMFTRLLYGGRRTMLLAAAITALAFALGVSLGLSAGIIGRWYDLIVSRVIDAVMAMPSLVVALLVLSVLGSSIPVLISVIALLEATRFFRLSRAISMDLRQKDFIDVARLRGEGLLWILGREVLPNSINLLTVELTLRFGFTVLFISSLSFLGLGVQPPYADWGSMVRENAIAINFGIVAPLIPAAAIAGLVVTSNLLVDFLSGDRATVP